MFLFSSLFIIQLFFFFVFCFFCEAGFSLSRRLCWFIPGVAVGLLHATYLLTCCSASPKQFWSQCLTVWDPSVFSVLCGVEKLYMGWGFKVSGFWFFLEFFSWQVWFQHLSKVFDIWSSHCLLLLSSHHLGSQPPYFK
jgi:hypothetical protein